MSRLVQIEKMLAAEPADLFLNFALAMECLKAGRHEQALAQFTRVSELDPNYIPAYFQKGQALASLGRLDEARSILSRGIQVARQTGDAHAAAEMEELLSSL